MIEDSLKKNEDHVASLNSAITEFRNFERKASSDCSNQLNNDHNITSSSSFLSVDHLNRRVIKSTPPLLSNTTEHILEYDENFLNPDERLKISQFLDSCTDFVKNGTMKTLNFGKTHNQPTRTNSNKQIPEPFRAVIDILHEKYSIQDVAKLNSVIINKFSGPHAKLAEHSFNDPSINSDYSIFTLSISDSCPVVFRGKCTNETVVFRGKCTNETVVFRGKCTNETVVFRGKCTNETVVFRGKCTNETVVFRVKCTNETVVFRGKCTNETVVFRGKCTNETVVFRGKCTNETVVFRGKCTNETEKTTDNSILMISSKSQHYWTRKILT